MKDKIFKQHNFFTQSSDWFRVHRFFFLSQCKNITVGAMANKINALNRLFKEMLHQDKAEKWEIMRKDSQTL
jgi:hypothetical protein